MKQKALIIDVDGTLVTSHDTLPSKRVIKTLRQLQKKKIHVVFATARPFNEVKDLCDLLGVTGYAIVSGGAQLRNISKKTYEYEYPILVQDTIDMCKQMQDRRETVRIWIQDNGRNYDFGELYMPQKPFIIVASGLQSAAAERIIRKNARRKDLFFTKVFSRTNRTYEIHISHENATKKFGLQTLTTLWGIQQTEIVGVGDGYNDIPLLQASGIKVAMGNAIKKLKHMADYVAPRVEDDGLAVVIKKYF